MTWQPILAAATQGGGQGSIFGSFLFPFAIIIVIFYFLLIAPARKQRKQMQQMLDSLSNGDKVVTTGGLHGTVVGVADQVVKLRIASSVQVDVSRSAIASKESAES